LRAAGLSAPGDISITGFDDLFFAPYLQPPLTTVRQPMHEMGRSAMTLLLELLAQNGDGAGELERNVKMSGELVVRKSTAPPGGN
jgi:DNA-binding LacI/PurR family transcriptional regulator